MTPEKKRAQLRFLILNKLASGAVAVGDEIGARTIANAIHHPVDQVHTELQYLVKERKVVAVPSHFLKTAPEHMRNLYRLNVAS